MRQLVCLAVWLAAAAGLQAVPVPKNEFQPLLKGRATLVIVASEGFRDEEYMAVSKLFKRHQAAITVASTKTGTARGMGNLKVAVDKELSAVHAAGYAAVVFIGGVGARTELWDNPDAQRLAREAAEGQGALAAICYAPGILAKAGVLKGRTASVFRDRYTRPLFAECGATIATAHVWVDGHIITADGPEPAKSFADEIVKLVAFSPAAKGP